MLYIYQYSKAENTPSLSKIRSDYNLRGAKL